MNLLLGAALVSLINFMLHALVTAMIIVATRHTATLTTDLSVFIRVTALLIVTTVTLTVAHVAEVGIWASFISRSGITLTTEATALEFAFENYTALGYGDTIAQNSRLIGPITALNGLLLIGWSVAVIFEVLRMTELKFGRRD